MNKLLILDLDGTLIDSKQDIALSLNAALAEQGFPTLPQKKIEDLVGWGAKQLVREALGHPTEEDLGRVFLAFWRQYEAHCLDHTNLYPGVDEFLRETFAWQKAVVTNKPQLFTDKILAGLGIAHCFQWVIAGDTLSVQKPNPQVLSPILREVPDLLQRGVVIGDSTVDLALGKSAGLPTCLLSHGFGIREELERGEPEFLYDDFSQWRAWPFLQQG